MLALMCLKRAGKSAVLAMTAYPKSEIWLRTSRMMSTNVAAWGIPGLSEVLKGTGASACCESE